MNSEEQREAIAIACGLKNLRMAYVNDGSAVLICDCPEFAGQWTEVPEYLEDLNAMHEAEKTLHGKPGYHAEKWAIYERHLYDICDDIKEFGPYHATAPQRAEAFLKTLNLWKD